jgi:hypothetical protein
VAAGESAATLTVTATSTVDTTKSGTATIAVTGSGETIVDLIAGKWTNDSITTSDGEKWYKFTASSTRYVWWNDSYSGDGTKTLDVKVTAYQSDRTTQLFSVDSAWSSPEIISSYTGMVYLKVKRSGSSTGNTGTFAITYAASNTRPSSGASGSNAIIAIGSGEITITGDNGNNVISKFGSNGPTSLSLSVDSAFTNVVWYVDGVSKGTSASLELKAADYEVTTHSVTFTGWLNGSYLSSGSIPFTVNK